MASEVSAQGWRKLRAPGAAGQSAGQHRQFGAFRPGRHAFHFPFVPAYAQPPDGVMTRRCALAALLAMLLAGCTGRRNDAGEVCARADTLSGDPQTASPPRGERAAFRVLVFSRHAGYAHRSIPAGTAALHAIGAFHGFSVEATEAARRFTDEGLRPFRVVIFLNTTGDVLNAGQQAAFTRYIRAGGGFVGIHSASDTEHDWEWYHRLLGAEFAAHPPVQRARLRVDDRSHPSTRSVPREWTRTDEWYDYRAPPPPNVRILVSVDESTYTGGHMGASHPVSWAQEFEGGRAWYTSMGHTTCSYAEPAFLRHLTGGIIWAAGEDDDGR
jgi:type 1 glutamine amidotransferase